MGMTLQSSHFLFKCLVKYESYTRYDLWSLSFPNACSFHFPDKIRGDNLSISLGRGCVTFWGLIANALHLHVYMNNS